MTGGSRGIGRAVCERLGRRGMKVAVGSSGDRDAAEEVAGGIPGATVHQGTIGERAGRANDAGGGTRGQLVADPRPPSTVNGGLTM